MTHTRSWLHLFIVHITNKVKKIVVLAEYLWFLYVYLYSHKQGLYMFVNNSLFKFVWQHIRGRQYLNLLCKLCLIKNNVVIALRKLFLLRSDMHIWIENFVQQYWTGNHSRKSSQSLTINTFHKRTRLLQYNMTGHSLAVTMT